MELTAITNASTWLILIALACFAYLSWSKPINGLYLIVATLPSYLIRLTIGGIPTTVLELAIIILFLVWLLKENRWQRINIRFWQHRQTTNAIPPEYRGFLALLLVSGLIGLVISPDPQRAFGIFKAYLIEPTLLFMIATYEIQNERQVKMVLRMLGLTTIIIGSIAIWQYASGLGIDNPFWAAAGTRRITTFFGYPNANSLFIAPIVALYLGFLRSKESSIAQLYKILVLALGIATIFMARTSGAVIALISATIIAFLIERKRWRLPIGAMLILAVICIFSLPTTRHRLGNLANNIARDKLTLTSSSFEIRINQWRETVRMLGDNPLVGAGLAGYQAALTPYHRYQFLEIYLYPHNIFLNFWTELGLLGLVSTLWLLFAIAKNLTKTYRAHEERPWLATALLLAWLTVIIHGLVDVPFFKNDLSVLWMLLVSLTVVLMRLTTATKPGS